MDPCRQWALEALWDQEDQWALADQWAQVDQWGQVAQWDLVDQWAQVAQWDPVDQWAQEDRWALEDRWVWDLVALWVPWMTSWEVAGAHPHQTTCQIKSCHPKVNRGNPSKSLLSEHFFLVNHSGNVN